MARKKLQKFHEIRAFSNVIEDGKPLHGQWAEAHFGNAAPIILELACGRGEYTVALASLFPKNNYVGVDKKGERIWHGARAAQEATLANAAFLRGNIARLEEDFAEHEVSEIWITFPGPFPKKQQANKRLTHPRFLEQYARILETDGVLHLKTDDQLFLEYSIAECEKIGCNIQEICMNVDERATDTLTPLLEIQTTFERLHRSEGRMISYLRVRFTPQTSLSPSL